MPDRADQIRQANKHLGLPEHGWKWLGRTVEQVTTARRTLRDALRRSLEEA